MKRLLLRIHKLARILKPLRSVWMAFTFIALLLTIYCLFITTAFTAEALEPAIVASLWGMLILVNIEIFNEIPDPPLADDTYWHRILIKVKLLFYRLLALLIIVVSALLLWLSLRLLLI